MDIHYSDILQNMYMAQILACFTNCISSKVFILVTYHGPLKEKPSTVPG